MRGNEDSDPFRMAELMDSDEEVPDGVGCTEIWEHMSEVRESDDDDTTEGECQEDDDTDMIPAGYVVDEETGEVPGVDLDDGEGGGMNWDSERDMARDVEENKDLYEALAAHPDDEDEE